MSIEQTNKTNLLAQTQQFWKLSRQWNGIESSGISAQDAMQLLGEIISSNNPKRRLSQSSGVLLSDIIAPRRASKKRKAAEPTALRTTSTIDHQDVG